MKTVNIILMGFGNVGRAFIRIIYEKSEICRKRYGLDLQLRSIFELEGALFPSKLIKLDEILDRAVFQLTKHPLWKSRLSLDYALEKLAPGVLVECTPTDIKTGEPGLSHIMKALERGWHVATANKGPLVVKFQALRQKAEKKKLALKFSAATAAALPALDIGLYSLAGTEILGIEGILNGTTNYILTRMAEGLEYKEALKEAQAKGIAEADPSLDVEGWDTASKLLLISNAVVGTNFALKDIKVEGMTNLSTDFVMEAKSRNKALKLLGKLTKKEAEFRAEVGLSFMDEVHPLFGVKGTNKGIIFFTDIMGEVTVIGGKSDPKGAAATLLKDIINIYSA